MNEEEKRVHEMMQQVFNYAKANKVNIKVKPFIGVAPKDPAIIRIDNLVFQSIPTPTEIFKD